VIERLRQDTNVLHADICAENDNLQAEIERLRGARGRIRGHGRRARVQRGLAAMTDLVERLRDPQDGDFNRCRIDAADEIERLRAEIDDYRGRIAAILATAGGLVEGQPTGKHNILQRLRALREIEDASRVRPLPSRPFKL
jgi:hypothetical protein